MLGKGRDVEVQQDRLAREGRKDRDALTVLNRTVFMCDSFLLKRMGIKTGRL